ncbi:MAG: universal stress protein [Thermodesulfobacteriota bacterium]
MKIEKLLFPTDFSPRSISAREYTIYMAQAFDASVYLLHAIEPLKYDEVDDEIKDFYTTLETQLSQKMELEKEAFEKMGVNVNTDIVIGQRWRVINAYAREKGIDLIIMGSHGIRTESGDISIGTTSHRVMFSSPCPVLIVRHEGV